MIVGTPTGQDIFLVSPLLSHPTSASTVRSSSAFVESSDGN